MNRREFIKSAGMATLGLGAAACAPRGPKGAAPIEGQVIQHYPGTGLLGYGCMRWPEEEDGEGGKRIIQEEVNRLVDEALSHGVNYFDTSPVYHGGDSERAAGEALVKRHPRDSFTLATKLHNGFFNSREDMEKVFADQLEQTGAGYFDFYLLHALQRNNYTKYDEYHIWDFARELKEKGLVKHYGFSFHADPELLEELLTAHPDVEFVQLQINYADWENPAIKSRECYEVVRRHGKSVVIMEPVKGGLLADPPEAVANILKAAEPDMSVASWAVRFAADLEGLITVLSGMSSVEQMKDNLSYMKDFRGLTASERETIAKAQEEMAKIDLIPCTSCNYCAKVCPKDIGISGSFTAMNLLTLYGNKDFAAGQEGFLVGAYGRQFAKNCVKCGKCEQVCPQHIAIRDNLEKVAATFPHEDPAPAEA